jgi:hypothetical protein
MSSENKTPKVSVSIGLFKEEFRDCKHTWDCFCQAGDSGIVFSKSGNYKTAFFEAFPRDPDTFIRGEGKTIEEAEDDCWAQYEKIKACPNHEFERRGRTDGYAYCKHCNLSGSFLKPTTKCCKCGELTAYTKNLDVWLCKDCYDALPDAALDEFGMYVRRMFRLADGETKE